MHGKTFEQVKYYLQPTPSLHQKHPVKSVLKNSYSEKFREIPIKTSMTASSMATNTERKPLSSLYLTHSFSSSSFSLRHLSLSIHLNFLLEKLLDFAKEKDKPGNVLVRHFSARNIKQTPKL